MNLFEDLKQRVTLLNSQLRRVRHEPGSETRKILHNHLWRIVEELNGRLHLELKNTALDLYAEESDLIIHYYDVSANNEVFLREVFLRIDPSFSVERRTRAILEGLSPAEVSPIGYAKQRFKLPNWD